MNVNLPAEIDSFVKNLVAQGTFDSEEAAVVEGIRLLMTREKLRGEIRQSVQQLDDDEWLDEAAVFEEINSEIDNIEASQQES